MKERQRSSETFIPFDASYITTIMEIGYEAVKKTLPSSLNLIGGILLILFNITGCSDSPQLGPMLTVNDVDRYITTTEDSVCLLNGADSTCVMLLPEPTVDENGVYGPIIQVHPTRLIYVFYREGVTALRADRETDTTQTRDGVGDSGGDDGAPKDDTPDADNTRTVVRRGGSGGGGTVGHSDTDDDDTPPGGGTVEGGGGGGSTPRSDTPGTDGGGGGNNNNGGGGNNNGGSGGNNNNGGGGGSNGSDCNEDTNVVWVGQEEDSSWYSGVIHSCYVKIDKPTTGMLTFTGPDGEIHDGDKVRAYTAVETGLTYEEASRLAPEILREYSRE